MIQVTNEDNQLVITTNGVSVPYNFTSIKAITPYASTTTGAYVHLVLSDQDIEKTVKIRLADVDNQVTWTNDFAGAKVAVDDIQVWAGLVSGFGAATEATLLDVLAAVDSMRDYEVRLVVDSDAPPVTWLEVRYWDVQGDTLGTPVYYAPGSTVAGTPSGSLTYINPNTLLSLIQGELIALNAIDYATETSLAALSAKLNSLGQKASVDSAPVVLSTEQEVILDAIKTAVEAINIDTDGLATEATLAAIETLTTTIDAVLDAIALDTANLDVALSTLTTEATAAAIEALLTTIDADTSNLDVALSTVATEATLSAQAADIALVEGYFTSVTRTPSMIRVVGAGAASVTAGKRRVTIFNSGGADGDVLGATLKSGEVVTFVADGEEDTLAAISYDALTSELLITTIV